MTDERQPFERITRALVDLGQDDLLNLLKAVEELRLKQFPNPSYKGQIFRAEGIVFEEPSDQPMTLQEMLLLLRDLDPAELQVLSTLIPSYLDGMRGTGPQHVSATWGTTNPAVAFASNVGWTGPTAFSPSDMQQRAEIFKACMALIQPAQEAKAAGNHALASQLLEQAMNLLKEQGIPDPLLEHLRNLFLS